MLWKKKLEVTRNLVFGETYSVKLANGKTLKVDTNLDKNLVVKSGQTIFRKIPQEFEECTYQKRHSSTLLKKDHQKFFKIHLSTQKSRYLLKR